MGTMIFSLVISCLSLSIIKSQEIEWFKNTQHHENNIEHVIDGWKECPDWSRETSTSNNSFYNLTALCITIQVPLNWDECNINMMNTCNNITTIDYFITRIFSELDPNNTNKKGAFWMLNGGPGSSGGRIYWIAIPVINFFDHSHDLYLPDHRGTGWSNLLDCKQESIDIIQTIEECAQTMNNIYGDNLQYFSTYSASMDLGYAVDLFQTDLSIYNGNNDIIYGVSYGTYYLNQYLTLFPNQFNASIFDSMAPPDIGRLAHFDNGSNIAGLEFIKRCNENIFCQQRFSELNTTIFDAIRMIFNSFKDESDVILECVDLLFHEKDADYLRNIFYRLSMSDIQRSLIPPIMYRIYRCNDADKISLTQFIAEWDNKISDEAHDPNDTTHLNSAAILYNIMLSEMWDGLNASDPGRSVQDLARAQEEYYFSYGSVTAWRSGWDIWNRYTPKSDIYNKYANVSIPMLLIHGDLDPQTNILWGDHAAKKYGMSVNEITDGNNRYYFKIPNAPHASIVFTPITNDTSYYTEIHDYEACGLYIIKSFIDPNTGYIPDDACIAWLIDIDWNATLNVTKQKGSHYFGTYDVWGIQTPSKPCIDQ